MRLIQVRVVHSETVSPQQYHSRKHEVELTVSAEDDEGIPAGAVANISQNAMDAVRDFIQQPRKQIAPGEDAPRPAKVNPTPAPKLKEAEKVVKDSELHTDKEEATLTELMAAEPEEKKKPGKYTKSTPPPKTGPVPFDDKIPEAAGGDPEPEDGNEEIDDDEPVDSKIPAGMMSEDELVTASEDMIERFGRADSLDKLKLRLERNMRFLVVLKEKRPNENDRVTRAYRDRRSELKKG
jgi:hypothetical protein